MERARAIVVMGGGLAGLAAAIAAARRGDAVTLCESHAYGRDKVCGEFLSAELADDLDALGCGAWREELGPVPMRGATIFGGRGARLDVRFPGPPSWALTRRVLEAWLADRARDAGVTVRERSPVRELRIVGGRWIVRAGDAEIEAATVIGAFGKRSTLDAPLGLPRASLPERFGAVKAYFPLPAASSNAALSADVELHLVPGGYVGLNAVEGGRVGLCALLEGDVTSDWPSLAERFSRSPSLAPRIAALGSPLGPVRGLARFGFGAQKLVEDRDGALALFCGDAARMIPSFTGDGMAIALRSGRMAAAALDARDPAAAYRRAYAAELDGRLRVAALLHRGFLGPRVFQALAPLIGRAPRLVERLHAWTRGR